MRITAIRYAHPSSIALLVLLTAFVAAAPAGAQAAAPLIKRDTMLHLLGGAMTGLLAASAASAVYGRSTVEGYPLLVPSIAFSAALTAGIGKETLDSTGFGDPQWTDIMHTLIGGLIAAGVTAGVEAIGGGTSYQSKTILLAVVGVSIALPVGAGFAREIAIFLHKERAKR